jgi:proteasome lid subunit RPN8/RPN11
MPLGKLSCATTESPASGAPSRVKFVVHQGNAGLGAGRVSPPSASKITFLQRPPEATPLEPGRRSRSGLHANPLPCVETVPELSYELNSGCNITATMSGRLCHSLIDCCEESNTHGREVGGIVVGYRCERRDEQGQLQYDLVATDLIPINSSDSSCTHVCFTESAWAGAERELNIRFMPEGKRRLGWYHTHPVQGIFFSAQDQSSHGIFTEAYQFALVLDPRQMEAGLFYWNSYRDQVVAGPIRFPLARRRE